MRTWPFREPKRASKHLAGQALLRGIPSFSHWRMAPNAGLSNACQIAGYITCASSLPPSLDSSNDRRPTLLIFPPNQSSLDAASARGLPPSDCTTDTLGAPRKRCSFLSTTTCSTIDQMACMVILELRCTASPGPNVLRLFGCSKLLSCRDPRHTFLLA